MEQQQRWLSGRFASQSVHKNKTHTKKKTTGKQQKKVPSRLKSLLSLHVAREKNAISNAFGAAATPPNHCLPRYQLNALQPQRNCENENNKKKSGGKLGNGKRARERFSIKRNCCSMWIFVLISLPIRPSGPPHPLNPLEFRA